MSDAPQPATSRGTARERLERILYLLPAASGEEGASLDELTRTLDVTRDVLLADVEEVTARAYNHPAGGGDDLQVYLGADRLRVWTTGEFRRPPKLTPREGLALGIGLRALAGEVGVEKRAGLLDLARRLERRWRRLRPPDQIRPRPIRRTPMPRNQSHPGPRPPHSAAC
jgi:hypothetical protein